MLLRLLREDINYYKCIKNITITALNASLYCNKHKLGVMVGPSEISKVSSQECIVNFGP